MVASPLDDLQKKHPLIGFTPSAVLIAAMILSAVIWSFFAQLEEVSVATGTVIPQGKIKVIQHLEGGIITDIYVQEGDVVRLDTPLLQLDLGAGGLNIDELAVKLDGLYLKRARLQAESADSPLDIPLEIQEIRPDLTQAGTGSRAAQCQKQPRPCPAAPCHVCRFAARSIDL